ncbi:Cytochrome b5 [Penicillium chermesinum]|nr:Cytochrome b5 [Penicillium chermesinum]
MAETDQSKRFTPKVPVQLDPPKDDPISQEELAKCDGTDSSRPTLVAIKGVVFDVSRNPAYGPTGQYRGEFDTDTRWRYLLTVNQVFAGKDPSRALAKSSLKPEDCVPDWYDLEDKDKVVLDEWFTFFSKRYNIVGKVEGATNT